MASDVSISPNNKGFTIDGNIVRWSTVLAIATYKRDLFCHDDICLAFKLSDDCWFEVSEEDQGFQSLVEEVERRFPDVPRRWFHEVMFPAFATNYRVLWSAAE